MSRPEQIERWDPFREMMTLRNRVDHLFEGMFARRRGEWMATIFDEPALDMYESEGKLKVDIPLPGVKPEEVELSISGNTLTIKGERKAKEEVKAENYYRQEWRKTMLIHNATTAATTAGAALTVEPIEQPRDRMRFITLPWQIYAGNSAWVPPLLFEQRRFFHPSHNPFFRHAEVQLFIARRGAHDVGTIAAFINRAYNQFQGTQIGFFGFFEVLMDAEAAAALLQTAEDWVRARGMAAIRGPINFATDNASGLLLDAFDVPPVIMTVYNPPYYRPFIEAAGFVKVLDWYAYTIDRATLGGGDPRNLPPKLLRAVSIARRRSDATFRKVRMRDFNEELARLQLLYNRAWERNPDFVPLDASEIEHMASDLKPFVDPDLVWVAEVGERMIGVSITLPDLNQVLRTMNGRLLPFGWWRLLVRRAHIDTARVFALGIVPDERQRGIDAVLYYETFCEAIRKGYQQAELSLIAEHNMAMRRTIEALGARIYKTYRVYEKLL